MVRMAQSGANIRDIAAVSGHSIDKPQKIIETYIPRRTEQALRAIEAWERAGSSASTVVRLASWSGGKMDKIISGSAIRNQSETGNYPLRKANEK